MTTVPGRHDPDANKVCAPAKAASVKTGPLRLQNQVQVTVSVATLTDLRHGDFEDVWLLIGIGKPAVCFSAVRCTTFMHT